MKLTLFIPEDLVERVKESLPDATGVLEAIAVDAILEFLRKLDDPALPEPETTVR
jgi:hypothetical protein